jgi:hypothetical protein
MLLKMLTIDLFISLYLFATDDQFNLPYKSSPSPVTVTYMMSRIERRMEIHQLDSLGIESQRGRDFQHPSRPALGPTQPPVQ